MLQIIQPPPALADIIDMCWLAPASGKSGTSFHEVFPSGGMDLILRISPAKSRMVLMGSRTGKATVEIDGLSDYLGFRFKAAQSPAIVESLPREILNSCADVDRIGTLSVNSLADQIYETDGPTARMMLLGRAIINKDRLVRDKRCSAGGFLIEKSKGQAKVREIADFLNISPRTLERIFRDQLGLSPKRLLQMTRIKNLTAVLKNSESRSMAEIAAYCGYNDQAHMIRDMKQMTGYLPTDITHDFRGKVDRPRTEIIHRYRK